ncbi:hypothetical protein ACFHW0_28665, partial [Micromonospora sp. LOL_025]|uniref:hypothetical protein n=1 Tax=Micromonospora sp. LOL_025 TaxID=3345413 RepID=UPI003A8986C1
AVITCITPCSTLDCPQSYETSLSERPAWWAALTLLGSFYAGTWSNSPHHSLVGDAVVLALAAAPTYIAIALGSVGGQYLASNGPSTSRL